MKSEEIQALAKSLAPVFREMIGVQIQLLRTELVAEISKAMGMITIPEIDTSTFTIDKDALCTQLLSMIPLVDEDALVQKVLAKIPTPANGENGKDAEIDWAKVEECLSAMHERAQEAHTASVAAAIESIPVFTPVDLAKEAAAIVLQTIEIPTAVNGTDGKDADMAMVESAVKSLLPALIAEPLAAMVEQVDKAIEAIPEPKDGAPGIDGQAGTPGKDGADGVSPTADDVALLFERRFSDQLMSIEHRFVEWVNKAVDRIPTPSNGADGKDGADAFQLEAFNAELQPDGRTVLLTFAAGETSKEFRLSFPVPVDAGQWRETGPEAGGNYVKGDGVSYGGSFFIAQVDNPVGAPGTTKAWRLSVKHGRDGRDLRPNASTVDPTKGVSIRKPGESP